jgi:monovalent cation:H+ antiporter-2, CPA2 family
VGLDPEGKEIKKDLGLIVVCGYGRIGKVVCEVLDKKMIRYIAFDVDPFKTIQARNKCGGVSPFFNKHTQPQPPPICF